MKTYFSHIDADHWIAKNNAEKMAHEVARSMNHLLISESNLNKFKEAFKQKIADVNAQNKRCKPLQLDIWKPRDHIAIHISGVFSMSLYGVFPDETYK